MQRRRWPCVTLTVTLIAGIMLPPARASRSLILSRPIDTLLLEQHNIFRQEEKAANIFKMHWNDSAEAAAQRWADRCEFKHELAGTFGENLFYSNEPDESIDIREILLGGLEVWHDEKRGWRYTSDACGAACHYTQMVWSSTTSVGCAHKMCHGLKVGSRRVDKALYLVCYYWPRGNWIGEYPFKMGRPCSSCGSGTCQDGLCVEEKTSYSSYHSVSDNQVKSGSSWQWTYDARGDNSHHRASSQHNVSSTSTRHNGGHHVTRTSSRHDVSYTSRHSGHHRSSSHHTSSFSVSHSSLGRKPAELRHGKVTHASGGNVQRQLADHSPLRAARLHSLRQHPRQALYARAGLDRVSNTINGNNNNHQRYNGHQRTHDNHHRSDNNRHHYYNNNNYNNNGGRQRDEARRQSKSPLDVLREDTHWCRDRLPSCRIWTNKCLKSKAVYMACPRTCGHCGKETKNDLAKQANEVQDRPQPLRQQQSQLQRSQPLQQRPHRPQAIRLRQQPRQPTTSAPQRQHQHHQQGRSSRNGSLTRARQQRRNEAKARRAEVKATRMQAKERRRLEKERRRQEKEKRRQRKESRRQGDRQSQNQKQRRRQQHQGRRRRPQGESSRRKQHRRRVLKKYQTVDKKAESLAAKLRSGVFQGAACEDDPKYSRSCPFWVKKGFCNGNELVSNVYCQQSCGSC